MSNGEQLKKVGEYCCLEYSNVMFLQEKSKKVLEIRVHDR